MVSQINIISETSSINHSFNSAYNFLGTVPEDGYTMVKQTDVIPDSKSLELDRIDRH